MFLFYIRYSKGFSKVALLLWGKVTVYMCVSVCVTNSYKRLFLKGESGVWIRVTVDCQHFEMERSPPTVDSQQQESDAPSTQKQQTP